MRASKYSLSLEFWPSRNAILGLQEGENSSESSVNKPCQFSSVSQFSCWIKDPTPLYSENRNHLLSPGDADDAELEGPNTRKQAVCFHSQR